MRREPGSWGRRGALLTGGGTSVLRRDLHQRSEGDSLRRPHKMTATARLARLRRLPFGRCSAA